MELKNYQRKALEQVKAYIEETKKSKDPDTSFYKITKQTYKPFKGRADLPFVCIKIPTGGGKTILASHSVNEVFDKVYNDHKENGLVIWFVPSEAIQSQTLRKLKDRNDPHRQILDRFFDNNVKVFSTAEALAIRKDDIENNVCIIISILDSFRKESKDNYKVYKQNGKLLSHFENIDSTYDLDKNEDGSVIESLVNATKLNNPLVVIDEGHRAQTELSWETIRRLNPSFVLEYTATPRGDSNILINISSAELKEEKMVKLPIFLESAKQWQQVVDQGVAKREELEKISKKEKGEYIRPIALLQAQQEKEASDRVYVSMLLDYLEKTKKIPRDHVAIKTAKNNELENVDLFSKDCKIRYIITVSALGEGWDCSYAYVLISAANVGSKIAVEQIIGRIMRLPYAKEKKNEDLNYSYVFASAKNFSEAAKFIIDGIEEHGYSREDILDLKEKSERRELEFEKQYTHEFAVPLFAIKTKEGLNELQFGEDLIGEDFDISQEKPIIEFNTNYDQDALVKLDIKKDQGWTTEIQTKLKFIYKDKQFNEQELITWLDQKTPFKVLDTIQKRKFIQKIIKNLLDDSNNSLAELSVGRYILQDRIKEIIEEILTEKAKKSFDKLKNDGKLIIDKSVSFVPKDKIKMYNFFKNPFQRHFYKYAHKLNGEEEEFAYLIDNLENVDVWYRNVEKIDFYIQGWRRGRFCPDFIVKTKKGNYIVLEYKGKDRETNEDTQYKVELGKIWEELDKGNYYFDLVTKDKKENVLDRVKEL